MSYDKMSLGITESNISNRFLDLGQLQAFYPFKCIVKPQKGLGLEGVVKEVLFIEINKYI